MAKKLKRPKRKKPLSAEIETIVTPDQPIPEELQTFLHNFFEDLSQMQYLPNLDLTTQEGAREATVLLEARFAEIQERMKTARALKSVLEQERNVPGSFRKLGE